MIALMGKAAQVVRYAALAFAECVASRRST